MAPRGVFSYRNLDNTSDLNARFQGLVLKGVYNGGRFSALSGSYTVSVSPYIAITSDGMMVVDTESTNVSVAANKLQYIVIDATYNPAGAAPIYIRAVGQAELDTYRDKYICLGIVNTTSGNTGVSASDFSYSVRDQVTPVQDSKFIGYFADDAARNSTYPTALPCRQRVGDYAIVGTDASTLKFCFWSGTSWLDFNNPNSIATALNAHIQDTNVHLTQDQKNALAGTTGHPSDTNRFITDADTRVLTADERDALSNALGAGAGVSGSNPIVAKGTVIAVPRVYQVAVPVTGNSITLSAQVLGIPEFSVYVGKQNIDNTTGISSAVQYFAIEDDFGNGYISTATHLPVYIINVTDSTNTTLNPSGVADAEGFYSVSGTDTIVLQLSTDITANSRPSIRLNVRGDLASMTPNWPGSGNTFLPAMTAFRYGKQSFSSALQGEFTALTVGSRTGSNPNVLFSTSSASGVKTVNTDYNAGTNKIAGISVIVDGTGAGTISIQAPRIALRYDATHGVVFDSTGVHAQGGVFVGNGTTDIGGIDADGRIKAAQGSAELPGLYFNGDGGATGLYYIPQLTEGTNNYTLNIYNSVGVSINGKTALLIGRDSDTSGLTDMDCPLMILQDYYNDGSGNNTASYSIGLQNAYGSPTDPGFLRFGYWSDSAIFATGLKIDFVAGQVSSDYDIASSKQFIGRVTANGLVYDEAHPSYTFKTATNTGMFYVADWTNANAGVDFTNGIGFSVNGKAALVITRDATASGVTTGVADPLILNQHVENATVYYDFAIADKLQVGPGTGSMRFGYVSYTGGFFPMLELDTQSSSHGSVLVHSSSIVFDSASASLVLGDAHNVQLDTNSLDFNSVGQGIGANNGELYVGSPASAYIGFNRGTGVMEANGRVVITGNSVARTPRLSINNGQVFAFDVTSTRAALALGTVSSDAAKIGWGYDSGSALTVKGYLTTSGKVFAARDDGNVTYGFLGVAGVGIGMDNTGALVLHGNVVYTDGFTAPSISTSDLHVTGNALVDGVLAVSGSFNPANITTGGITAASASVTGAVGFNSLVGHVGAGSVSSNLTVDKAVIGTYPAAHPTFTSNPNTLVVGYGGTKRDSDGFPAPDTNEISAGGIDVRQLVYQHLTVALPTSVTSPGRTWYVQYDAYAATKATNRMFRLSKARTPTDNVSTYKDPMYLSSGTIWLDGNVSTHIIRMQNTGSSVPVFHNVPNLGTGGTGDVVDYAAPNIETSFGNPQMIQVTVDDTDIILRLDADEGFNVGDSYKIIFMADSRCDQSLEVDLVDNMLHVSDAVAIADSSVGTNSSPLWRWADTPRDPDGYVPATGPGLDAHYVYTDTHDGNAKYYKFAAYRFVDQASLDYGGYPGDANGFELNLLMVGNRQGFTSGSIDGTNWITYIKRFGRR